MALKRVIIVDDHKLFARSLEQLVNGYPDYEVVDTLNNGSELVEKLSSGMENPHIILLDVKMPLMDGVATMKWLKKYRPFVKVIALSMEDEETTVLSMIKNGAKGYLLKDIEPEMLKKALDTVVNDGYFHTDIVTLALMHNLEDDDTKKIKFDLKENEIKFIQLACEEKTYKEIADEMMLSIKTIEGYRQHLFELFKVKNRIGLMIFAIKNKMIDF